MTKIHTKLIRYIFLPLMATATLWGADPAPFENGFCDKPELNIPASECEALHDFWDTTGGPNWTHTDGWGVDTNVSKWYGITLTDDATTNDGRKSVHVLRFLFANNVRGELPTTLSNLTHLYWLIIVHDHLYGRIPLSLNTLHNLRLLNLAENDFNGTLSICDSFPQNIEEIILNDNHYTGSVPSCLNNFTHLTELYFEDNNLSGPLPDLSSLANLHTLHLEHNQFTFADFEPQMGWLRNVNEAWYAWQRGHYDGVAGYLDTYPGYFDRTDYSDPRNVCQNYYVDERDHVVYFDTTLRIEPRVPANTYSDHDYFAWYKEDGTDEGQLLPNGGQRIYLKEEANASDAGYYYYEANNSVVTSMIDGRVYLTYCSTPRTDGIHAIHDAAPRWGNAALPDQVATVDVAYSYSSTIRDDDAEDTLSVTITGNPGWLSLAVHDHNVTLSGTPQAEDAGQDYNITMTLSDGKIPQTRHWLLHVNTVDLPDGISHEGETYTQDTTHTSIQAPHAWVTTTDDTLRLTYPCEDPATAYATLSSEGTLVSGYRNCETNATTSTLRDPYPAGTTLSLSPQMIEADVNLSTTITMGE